jgi:DHA2 family multidrug resistance protein
MPAGTRRAAHRRSRNADGRCRDSPVRVASGDGPPPGTSSIVCVPPLAAAVTSELQLSRGRRNVLAGAAILATAVQTLDVSIANTALPTMQGSLSASQDQIAWVVTAYAVAAAIATAPTAFLAARFGHRRVFALSMALFTFFSVMCGLATSVHALAVLRFLQGLSGAALMPLSQSTISMIFPPEQRSRAFAGWMMGVLLGPILGPAVGGWLTEEYSWRWIFLINIVPGIAAFSAIWLGMPEIRSATRPRLNWTGFLLLSVAVGCLQLVLDRGQTEDWFSSPEIVTEAVLSGAAFYFFAVHMLRSPQPFLPLEIFRNRTFVVAVCLAMIATGLVYATMTLTPAMLQTVYGYPVAEAGLLASPRGLGAIVSMLVIGRYGARIGPRWLVSCGLLIMAAAIYAVTGFSLDTDAAAFVWTGVAQGMGIGLVFTPLQVAAFNALSSNLQTYGATLFGLGRSLGGAVFISIMVTQLARFSQRLHERLAEQVTTFETPVARLPELWNWGTTLGAGLIEREVARQAVLLAYLNVFTIMTLVALAALPLVLLLREPKRTAATTTVPGAAVVD